MKEQHGEYIMKKEKKKMPWSVSVVLTRLFVTTIISDVSCQMVGINRIPSGDGVHSYCTSHTKGNVSLLIFCTGWVIYVKLAYHMGRASLIVFDAIVSSAVLARPLNIHFAAHALYHGQN